MQALSQKQQTMRKSLLRATHTSPVYLSIYKDDENAYRQMLQDNFGKRSAAQLNISQLLLLKKYLNGDIKQPVQHVSQAQQNYIKNQWVRKAKTPTEKALREFISKLFKKTVLHINALTKKEANGLINAINRM